MPTCAHPDCSRKIRTDNKVGVCQSHYKYTGTCKKCLQRCWIQAEYCQKCSIVKKAFEAKRLVVCQYQECKNLTASYYKLCEKHFGDYKECRLVGCATRVKYNSKWGYCEEHRYLSRYHKEDGIEPLSKPEPLPLRRKRLTGGKVYEVGLK
jgi:hypothetical protein